MTINHVYLNVLKFVTIAFVLAFTAYAANSSEVVMDIDPFSACIPCVPENDDFLSDVHKPPSKKEHSFYLTPLPGTGRSRYPTVMSASGLPKNFYPFPVL